MKSFTRDGMCKLETLDFFVVRIVVSLLDNFSNSRNPHEIGTKDGMCKLETLDFFVFRCCLFLY